MEKQKRKNKENKISSKFKVSDFLFIQIKFFRFKKIFEKDRDTEDERIMGGLFSKFISIPMFHQESDTGKALQKHH